MSLYDIIKHALPLKLRKKLGPIFPSVIYRQMIYRSNGVRALIKELKKDPFFREGNLNALEIFGKEGEWITKAYRNYVKTLEIWEIDRSCEARLRKNFPNDIVKITDSFREITTVTNKYSFVVCDNPPAACDGFCEHFEMFPLIFNVLDKECFLIINVVPCLTEDTSDYGYDNLFNEEQLKKRREFYHTEHPDDIPLSEMEDEYLSRIHSYGYEVLNFFKVKRHFVWFFVFHLKQQVAII